MGERALFTEVSALSASEVPLESFTVGGAPGKSFALSFYKVFAGVGRFISKVAGLPCTANLCPIARWVCVRATGDSSDV